MNFTEAKARRAAGKSIRQFQAQVAHKQERLNALAFEGYDDAVGQLDVTDVKLTFNDLALDPIYTQVHVTAAVELTRTRYDEHLTDDDAERVARAAFDDGRSHLIHSDFDAAVTVTPVPDLSAVATDIETVLNFTAAIRLHFHVRVVMAELHEDVAALGFNIGPTTDPDDFQFVSRAQVRLNELHQVTPAAA
jgi:hypothetical protein